MYIHKTFSFPDHLWDQFSVYLEEHPEINVSGLFQKYIRMLLQQDNEKNTDKIIESQTAE